MIARLRGVLAESAADHAVIDVGGVGYLALASARTLSALGPVGGDVLVFTEMQVREDAITLYAFGSAGERDAFRLLTSVQGVGGRVALAILSVLDPGELARAIAGGDKAMVARANGVGPKLAMRIVNELKDRMGGVAIGIVGGVPVAAVKGTAVADALSALANLGFRPAEASAAVAAAVEDLGDGATLDALVRLALRKAAK
jgi:Holliday junction DNA helicase RuvA